jgi:hypothetical protein
MKKGQELQDGLSDLLQIEMILGWSSSKIVSGISEHRPR